MYILHIEEKNAYTSLRTYFIDKSLRYKIDYRQFVKKDKTPQKKTQTPCFQQMKIFFLIQWKRIAISTKKLFYNKLLSTGGRR